MKIQIRLFIAVALIFSLTSNIYSQGGKKITLTPAELQKEESVKSEPDPLSELSTAQKNAAREKAQVLAVYLTKAILHKSDPATYPLDENNKLEKRSLDAIKGLSQASLAKAYSLVQATMANPQKMRSVYGKFKNTNYKIKQIATQLKKAGMEIVLVEEVPKVMIAEDNKMRFMIKGLHCIDQTNPEGGLDDDMIIGGILIGNGGRTHAGNTLVSCKLKDNETCHHGDFYFGGVGLNMGTFPKSFYCVLVLAEADSDQQESATEIHNAIQSIAAMIDDQGIDTNELAAAVKYTIDSFLPVFSSESFFPAEVLRLNMVNGNSLGSDNQSDELRTPNINGHGGGYRLNYFWRKVN